MLSCVSLAPPTLRGSGILTNCLRGWLGGTFLAGKRRMTDAHQHQGRRTWIQQMQLQGKKYWTCIHCSRGVKRGLGRELNSGPPPDYFMYLD